LRDISTKVELFYIHDSRNPQIVGRAVRLRGFVGMQEA
jgi:hypothetical protein